MPGTRNRRSARELGLAPLTNELGAADAITDVPGVRVGHTTLVEGTDIRTGVTAIVPDAVDRAGGELAAGLFVGNGFGKLVGATQLVELGVVETPILLTGTLSAFRAADALVTYMLGRPGNEAMVTVNPVVGETNDGFLSDIRARPITEQHVLAAIGNARTGPVEQGCVGAGTGTAALGFKAGIGTASRTATLADGAPGTVGVLVQANFSGTLTVLGVPIDPRQALAGAGRPADELDEPGGNSCMIIVAVDRALDSRQLTRVAKRAVFAMGRAGADYAPGSGDYAIAFSTGLGPRVADAHLGPVFAAAAEAACEAILNSVFLATTTTGYRGNTRFAVPLDFVAAACERSGAGRGGARAGRQGELCSEIEPSQEGAVFYAFGFQRVGVVVGDLYFVDPRPGPGQEGAERGVRLELRMFEPGDLRGSIYSARPIEVSRPVWRADLLETVSGPPGSLNRAHHHPKFNDWEPGHRVFDPDLTADPVTWVGKQLSDLSALLTRGGVDVDESFAADAQTLRERTPEIMTALSGLLDDVKAGKLATAPLGDEPESARVSWL